MTMTRLVLSLIESFGCVGAMWLAAEGYWIAGYLLAFGMVMLGWAEGTEGWGSPAR